jgi:hypothetical protein
LRRLATPPAPCLVPPEVTPPVFDAFGWCASDWLDWRTPASGRFDDATPLDGADPHRMVFVFHEGAPRDFLPR